MSVYLAEVVAATDSAGTTTTLRFSTGAYVTGPAESPADAFYDPRIKQPANARRELAVGAVRLGVGELVLINTDGGLDALKAYAFDGRACTIKAGADGAAYVSLTTVLRGTIDSAEVTYREVTLRLRDRLAELDRPLLTTRFAGNNSLPAGLEGTADDLRGQVKPRLYGRAFNLPVPCVNTSRLVYQVSDGAIQSIEGVYDRGAALTAGVARSYANIGAGSGAVTFTVNTTTDVLTTSTAHGYATGDAVNVTTTTTLPAPLAATTYYYARNTGSTTLTLHPTATDATNNTNRVDITTAGSGTHTIYNARTLPGHFDWSLSSSGSFVRLGSSPAGLVTVDATQGAAAGDRTAAQILRQIALDAGIASGDVAAADVTALDTDNAAVVGVWVADETAASGVMARIAQSVGAWFGFDRTGALRMRRLGAPTGTAVAELDATNATQIERLPGRAEFGGVPFYRVNVRHTRYVAVQPTDLAGGVSDARRALLATEYRTETASDAAVQTQWLLARELDRDTLLTSAADAATEAARLLTLYKARRDVYRLRVRLDEALVAALDLAAVVRLTFDRFGLDAGQLFIVIGIETDLASGAATLTVWG